MPPPFNRVQAFLSGEDYTDPPDWRDPDQPFSHDPVTGEKLYLPEGWGGPSADDFARAEARHQSQRDTTFDNLRGTMFDQNDRAGAFLREQALTGAPEDAPDEFLGPDPDAARARIQRSNRFNDIAGKVWDAAKETTAPVRRAWDFLNTTPEFIRKKAAENIANLQYGYEHGDKVQAFLQGIQEPAAAASTPFNAITTALGFSELRGVSPLMRMLRGAKTAGETIMAGQQIGEAIPQAYEGIEERDPAKVGQAIFNAGMGAVMAHGAVRTAGAPARARAEAQAELESRAEHEGRMEQARADTGTDYRQFNRFRNDPEAWQQANLDANDLVRGMMRERPRPTGPADIIPTGGEPPRGRAQAFLEAGPAPPPDVDVNQPIEGELVQHFLAGGQEPRQLKAGRAARFLAGEDGNVRDVATTPDAARALPEGRGEPLITPPPAAPRPQLTYLQASLAPKTLTDGELRMAYIDAARAGDTNALGRLDSELQLRRNPPGPAAPAEPTPFYDQEGRFTLDPNDTQIPPEMAPAPSPEAPTTLAQLLEQHAEPPAVAGPRAQGEVGATPENVAAAAKTGDIVSFTPQDVGQISLDPKTYQFKTSDARGRTSALEGVQEWDPWSPPIVLHRTPEGRLFVADGHQRFNKYLELAQAGQQLPPLRARIVEGPTPSIMRAASLRNIQEGSADPLDIARLVRNGGDLTPGERARVGNLSSTKLRQGQDLGRLGDDAFNQVLAGVAPPEHAAFVGRYIADPAQQALVVQQLGAAGLDNVTQAEAFVKAMRDAGFETHEQTDLFGNSVQAVSLAKPKAQIVDSVIKGLREQKRAFAGALANAKRLEAAGNVLAGTENARMADEAGKLKAYFEALYDKPGTATHAAIRDAAVGVHNKQFTPGAAAQGVIDALRKDLESGTFGATAAAAGRPAGPASDGLVAARPVSEQPGSLLSAEPPVAAEPARATPPNESAAETAVEPKQPTSPHYTPEELKKLTPEALVRSEWKRIFGSDFGMGPGSADGGAEGIVRRAYRPGMKNAELKAKLLEQMAGIEEKTKAEMARRAGEQAALPETPPKKARTLLEEHIGKENKAAVREVMDRIVADHPKDAMAQAEAAKKWIAENPEPKVAPPAKTVEAGWEAREGGGEHRTVAGQGGDYHEVRFPERPSIEAREELLKQGYKYDFRDKTWRRQGGPPTAGEPAATPGPSKALAKPEATGSGEPVSARRVRQPRGQRIPRELRNAARAEAQALPEGTHGELRKLLENGDTEAGAKWVKDAEAAVKKKEGGGGTSIAAGFAGLADLFKKDPTTAWLITRMAVGGVLGYRNHDKDPWLGALIGAASFAPLSKKFILGVGGRAGAKIASEWSAWRAAKAGVEATIPKGKLPRLRAEGSKPGEEMPWSQYWRRPEGAVPEHFDRFHGAYEQVEDFLAGMKLPEAAKDLHGNPLDDPLTALRGMNPRDPKARTQAQGVFFQEALSELRKDLKASVEAGHTKRANYLRMLEDAVLENPNHFHKVIGNLTGTSSHAVRRLDNKITAHIYRLLLGGAMDTSVVNRTQTLWNAKNVPWSYVGEGIKQAKTAEGIQLSGFAKLHRPIDVDDAFAKGKMTGLIDEWLHRPMNSSDTMNRRESFLGARQFAIDKGATPVVAEKWAKAAMRQTQSEPGPVGKHPFLGQLPGPVRMFQNYPHLWTEMMADTWALRHENPDGFRRMVGYLLGGALTGAATGINTWNVLFPRYSVSMSPWKAVADIYQHATGNADHSVKEDIVGGDGSGGVLVPRYIRQAFDTARHFTGYGVDPKTGEFIDRNAKGQERRRRTPLEALGELVGIKTRGRDAETERNTKAYEFLNERKQEASLHRRGVQRDLADAIDSGDNDRVAELMRGMTPRQRRDMRRAVGQTKWQRLRAQVPKALRREFDQQFAGQ